MIETSIYVSLGSNLGNRADFLRTASYLIDKEAGKVTKSSSLYETSAWGNTDQPNFLNQVLRLESTLAPEDLLDVLLSIEKQLGRERLEKWGPRTIDLDVLFYGDTVVRSASLTLPHPYLQDRKFILRPLAEIASEWVHPLLQKTVGQLLKECDDTLDVNLFKD